MELVESVQPTIITTTTDLFSLFYVLCNLMRLKDHLNYLLSKEILSSTVENVMHILALKSVPHFQNVKQTYNLIVDLPADFTFIHRSDYITAYEHWR